MAPARTSEQQTAAPERWTSASRPLGIRAALDVSYRLGLTAGVKALADRYWIDRSAPPWRRLRPKFGPCFFVLTYHRVSPTPNLFGIDTVPLHAFTRQMQCLARHYTVISLEEIVARLQTGTPLPPDCAAITFDDGYADNYHHAFPVLRALGLPATVYLATGAVGTGQVLWFDRVLRAFELTRCESVHLPFESAPQPLTDLTHRATLASRALFWLRSLPREQRDVSMRTLFAALHVVPPGEEPALMLDWEQVRAMSRQGLRFGSHTVSHPILSQIPLTEVARELSDSKRSIEEATDRVVTTFAYPSGRAQDYSPEIVDLVRRAGYQAAVTNTTFGVNAAGEDLFRLNRLRPWEEDLPSFFLKLSWYKLQDGGKRDAPASASCEVRSGRQCAAC
jgi:peptidoglycan/xylan/chitin deacetylase (PgdA/CDA1 family)